MSKSIASYPKAQQAAVITRRLNGSARGQGYWAAHDAINNARNIVAKGIEKIKETVATI